MTKHSATCKAASVPLAAESGQRANCLCPRVADNISHWVLFEQRPSGREATYIVGSRAKDRYITVPKSKLAPILFAVERFDGERTISELESELIARGWSLDVVALGKILNRAGLLADTDRSDSEEEGFHRTSIGLFAVSLTPITNRLTRAPSWIWPACAALGMAGILAATVYVALSWGRLWELVNRYSGQWTAGSNIAALLGLLTASFLIHESAHAFAAARYGIAARELRFALYLGFIPTFYVKVGGLYTVTPSIRAKIWSAGIFANLSLGSFAVLASPALSGHAQAFGLWVACLNVTIGLINLCPFLPTDGYFVMSSLSGNYNLRKSGLRDLRNALTGRSAPQSKLAAAFGFMFVLVVSVLAVRQLISIVNGIHRSEWWAAVGAVVMAASVCVLITRLWLSRRRR
ncbi:MAG TPA: M50 family metallopeptidase [Blastocatellia bacterium]|nr:M50 family metallopeptidase [Blastocatellia bacterium]